MFNITQNQLQAHIDLDVLIWKEASAFKSNFYAFFQFCHESGFPLLVACWMGNLKQCYGLDLMSVSTTPLNT